MGFLKWALGSVALLGLLFVVGGFLLPASAHVERSIQVQRDPVQVFQALNTLARFKEWSPWAALDPALEYRYAGPTSGVGAKMSWSSDKPEVGSGAQEIVEAVANQKVVLNFDFGQSQAISTYRIERLGEGSRVTWALDTRPSADPISRCFGAWMGLLMDKMVGPDFERGLSNLKQVLESDPPR